MNRVKKEIKKKGIKLESDYPYLPFYLKGKSCFEPGYLLLIGIQVKSETTEVFESLNTMTVRYKLTRKGELEVMYDD